MSYRRRYRLINTAKEQEKKANSKNTLIGLLKIAVVLALMAGYFCLIDFLGRQVNSGYLYNYNEASKILGVVGCFVFCILAIVLNKENIKWLRVHKKACFIWSAVCIVLVLLPFLFLKSGTVADEYSVQKKNMFGVTTEQFYYSDIKSIDVSVKSGIQYDIQFDSGEDIYICSHNALFNDFKNDENILKFDKIISGQAKKEVTVNPVWIAPTNTRRFFNDEEVFEYFDAFFREYYQ